MTRSWRIANWEEGFEVAQSRRRGGRLSWVAMPTRPDSRGYRKLIRGKDGVQHFAAWVAMVQVAARCEVRGVLADDRGVPLGCEDLEAMTDIPAHVFSAAIPVLCSIGWLLCPRSETTPSEVGAESEQGTTTVQYKTEQDKTEQDKTVEFSFLDSETAWQLIPKGKKLKRSKWGNAYETEIIDAGIDPSIAISAILRYYKSPEGMSEYFREPFTLLLDHVWDEDETAWEERNPQIDAQAEADEVFDSVYQTEGDHK